MNTLRVIVLVLSSLTPHTEQQSMTPHLASPAAQNQADEASRHKTDWIQKLFESEL